MIKMLGVVSDTHGLLRPEIRERLRVCDHIIHAGDIGSMAVLNGLRMLAPVTAVRGNVDRDAWAAALPKTECLEYDGKKIYVLHDFGEFDLEPEAAGIDIVIFGHSHQSVMRQAGRVLYLNPGSAGPKRFDLPVSMAYLRVEDGTITPRIIEIE